MIEAAKQETLADLGISLGDRFIRMGKAIIIADLHLGKTMHFRKAGLPIPAHARTTDQVNIISLLERESPETLIVLGDLFHSESNSEVDEFRMITSQYESVNFELVLGNHDILSENVYHSLDFTVSTEMTLGKLILTHEPMTDVPKGFINLHGHIHPGIRMRGKGRQGVTLPCFHLTSTHLCMPAFGALTGLAKRRPHKKDHVYAIAQGSVFEVSE